MASSSGDDPIKTGVKTVAIGFILYKVAGYVVGALICGIVSIVFLRMRWGWKSELRTIKNIECHNTEVKRCTGKNTTQKCVTEKKKSCQVRLEGIDRVLQKIFKPTAVPDQGDVMKVFFDPKRKEETASLNDFPSSIFGGIFGILCVIQVIYIVFLLKIEKAVAAA